MEFREFVEQEQRNEAVDYHILHMYLHSAKVSEIAQETGKSVGEIYRTLQKYNVNPNRLKHKHHQVFGFAQGGFNIGEISKLTGYSPRNVRYILSKQINED